PFRVPMSWKSRLAMLTAGAKVRAAVMKYAKVAQKKEVEDYCVKQQRIIDFMNNKTFSEFTGKLPINTDAICNSNIIKSTSIPDEVSYGARIGYFYMIWNKKGTISQNIMSKLSTLTNTITNHLKNKVEINAHVQEIIHNQDFVTVKYQQNGTEFVETAKYA